MKHLVGLFITLFISNQTFAGVEPSCIEKIKLKFEMQALLESIDDAANVFTKLTKDYDNISNWENNPKYLGTTPFEISIEQKERTDYDNQNNTDLLYINRCLSFYDDPTQEQEALGNGKIIGACGNPMAVHVNSECRIVRVKVNTL